jgi:hypothetical protein
LTRPRLRLAPAGSYQPQNDPSIPEPEPNNKFGSEYCLAANYSQGYGTPFGWAYTDLQCSSMLVPLCKIRPAGGVPLIYYKSNATLSTFALASDVVNASVAEAACSELGGHLATYASEAEQYEVEQVRAGGRGRGSCWPGWRGSSRLAAAQARCRVPALSSTAHHLPRPPQYYVNGGYIFPTTDPASYWLGYQVNASTGNWTTADLFQPQPDAVGLWGL